MFSTLESPSGAPTRGARRDSSGDPDDRSSRHRPSPLASALEDRRLVARLIARDPQAWRDFVAKYERLIVSRATAACREAQIEPRPELIEECSAELTSTLFHNDLAALRGFEGRAKFSTWLSVLIRRCTLGVIKRRRRDSDRMQQPDSRFDMAAVPDARAEEADHSKSDLLRTCLALLPQRDREILRLQFERQLSYAAIGEILGITENAVGPRLHRAQKRLRKLMTQRADE